MKKLYQEGIIIVCIKTTIMLSTTSLKYGFIRSLSGYRKLAHIQIMLVSKAGLSKFTPQSNNTPL